LFYSEVDAVRSGLILQILGRSDFVSDHTSKPDVLASNADTDQDLILSRADGFDHFNQFGDIWTYRFAGSYKMTRRTRRCTRASRPASVRRAVGQDFWKQFRSKPEEDFAWDAGIEQRFLENRITVARLTFITTVELDRIQRATLRAAWAGTDAGGRTGYAQTIVDLIFTALHYLDAESFVGDIISCGRVCRATRNEVYVLRPISGAELPEIAAQFVNARKN